MAGALFSYATGRRAVLAGASTITQQVIRNVFLPKFEGMTLQSARARSLKRKLLEQFLAIVLTSRASKDDILEMYLNEVPLGPARVVCHLRRRRGVAPVLREGRQQRLAG